MLCQVEERERCGFGVHALKGWWEGGGIGFCWFLLDGDGVIEEVVSGGGWSGCSVDGIA